MVRLEVIRLVPEIVQPENTRSCVCNWCDLSSTLSLSCYDVLNRLVFVPELNTVQPTAAVDNYYLRARALRKYQLYFYNIVLRLVQLYNYKFKRIKNAY